MGLFKRKDKFVDLSEHYRKQQEKIENMREEANEVGSSSSSSTGNAFGFLGNLASSANSTVSESPGYVDVSEDAGEKRKKLAKRLLDMTNKIEDLNNQIYHLQQRIEVLEKKSGASMY